MAHSKQELQCELNEPRIRGRTGNHTESGSRVTRDSRGRELRMIERINELGPELQRFLFANPGQFRQ